MLFWNPVTNVFVDYQFGGSGFAQGIDINLTAPLLKGPDGGVFGAPTFQPGDTWATCGFASDPLFVNLKGSNNSRFYGVGASGVRGVFGLKGVFVDQTTGMIFFTEPNGGTINRLDPATNTVTAWSEGGNPSYLTEDSSGNVFATVALATVAGGAGVDSIVELTPSTGAFKAWAIPGGGLTMKSTLATNGIAIDSAGNVWSAESVSNEVGRLNPATGEFCKFTRPSLTAHPQQIASSGSGATLQAFFTEAGAGEGGTDNAGAVSVLTQAASVPETSPCPVVTPATGTITPATSSPSFRDDVLTPRTNTITPTTTTVTANSGLGIDRFPMPFPAGGDPSKPNVPSGMTGVALPGTVFGSYEANFGSGNSAVFALQSAAIIAPPPSPPGTCTSGDATLVNEVFHAPGTLTYDVSSPTRVMSSIMLTASTNIGSSTMPTIAAGGHSATGGSLVKADTTKKATFTLQVNFVSPAFSCTIDPVIKKGHKKHKEDEEHENRFLNGEKDEK